MAFGGDRHGCIDVRVAGMPARRRIRQPVDELTVVTQMSRAGSDAVDRARPLDRTGRSRGRLVFRTNLAVAAGTVTNGAGLPAATWRR